MEKKPRNQIDRISSLPDEILHCILRRMETFKQAAQTSALSRQWRSLWQSYPVVEFDYQNFPRNYPWNLRNMAAASIRKFSPDSLLRMENLKLFLSEGNDPIVSSVAEQLLLLASNRKAEEISIDLQDKFPLLRLPLESLSDSSAKRLEFSTLAIVCSNGDLTSLSLNFLRFLRLHWVEISDERVLTNLIASSPLLETLELRSIVRLDKIRVRDAVNLRTLTISACYTFKEIEIVAPGLETLNLGPIFRCDLSFLSLNSLRFLNLSHVVISDSRVMTNLIASSPLLESLELEWIEKLDKIRVSDAVNLRTLRIYYCYRLQDIEIVAPGLETLNIFHSTENLRIDLIAPQLIHLRIEPWSYPRCDCNCIFVRIPELQLLKSLAMSGPWSEKILKFSSPKLEKFELWPTSGLEEIELDGGPDLSSFILHFNNRQDTCSLKKFEIRNAAAACLWELDCTHRDSCDSFPWRYLEVKSFLAKFRNRFHTVSISCSNAPPIFHANQTVNSIAIRHLKIDKTNCSCDDQNAQLDGLFCHCHPRYITFVDTDSEHLTLRLLQVFLTRYMEKSSMRNSREEPSEPRYNWHHQLKDVKIITQDIDQAFRKGEKEEEEPSRIVSEEAVLVLFAAQRQVCFQLTWG
ncbi:Putative F-box/LRR-repeat protein At3g28410 [Linum grandiflorum]